jgi:hypothetical protein
MYNYELMKRVLEAIKAEDIAKFNMKSYISRNVCGTTACIAGFTCLLLDKAEEPTFITAEQTLGFTEEEADLIFVNLLSTYHGSSFRTPEAAAIATLEHLLDNPGMSVEVVLDKLGLEG